MDFTREPIIECIITPKEGYKLVVRNSKSTAQEEYTVDAVEIVSFGKAQFYRSQEKPKSFLLPVTDYEVIELRETRAVLKAPAPEKSIKISGTKEQIQKSIEEPTEETIEAETGTTTQPAEMSEAERRRERRKMKKRKHLSKKKGEEERKPEEPKEKPTYPTVSRLLPPPPSLISETLTKFKQSPIAPEHLPHEGEAGEIPLPKGKTSEEPEVEREHPLVPEPLVEEHLSSVSEQVPYKSATPDTIPSQIEDDVEEDEPTQNRDDNDEGNVSTEAHFQDHDDSRFMF